MPVFHGVTIGSGVSLITPDADGSDGQVIQTDGSGKLSFVDPATGGATTFVALTDTPANYTGAGGKFLAVNSGATAVEFVDAPGGSLPITTKGDMIAHDGNDPVRLPAATNGFVLISDSSATQGVRWVDAEETFPFPATTKGDLMAHDGSKVERLPVGADDQILTADASAATGVAWKASGTGGVTTFVGLSDTPSNYSGAAGRMLAVNSGADAVEFVTAPTSFPGLAAAYAWTGAHDFAQPIKIGSGGSITQLVPGVAGRLVIRNDAGDAFGGIQCNFLQIAEQTLYTDDGLTSIAGRWKFDADNQTVDFVNFGFAGVIHVPIHIGTKDAQNQAGVHVYAQNVAVAQFNPGATLLADPVRSSSVISQGTADEPKATGAATVTLNLESNNHQTLNAGASAADIALTLTVPGGSAAGTVIISQGSTARNISFAASSGSVKWLGTQPTWNDSGEANSDRVVSWRWAKYASGATLYLMASDKG